MKLSKYSKGQGMTEYIIIVALIAVAAIAVFRYFGNTVRSQVGVATAEIGGQDSSGARTSADSNAQSGATAGAVDKKLSNYETGSH